MLFSYAMLLLKGSKLGWSDVILQYEQDVHMPVIFPPTVGLSRMAVERGDGHIIGTCNTYPGTVKR